MCEPTDDWPCKFDGSIELERSGIDLSPIQTTCKAARNCGVPGKVEDDFTFPCGPIPAEDDEEVTESKMRAFLDEKALDLKKLQTPLYEEFYSTMNATSLPGVVQTADGENALTILALPPKSRSPNQAPRRRLPSVVDAANNSRPGSHTKILLNVSGVHDRALQEIQQPQHSECKELLLDAQQKSFGRTLMLASLRDKGSGKKSLSLRGSERCCARQVQEGRHHVQMIRFVINRESGYVLHSQAKDNAYLTRIYATSMEKEMWFSVGTGHV